MGEWLKRDPDNGMLVGPKGAHFENENQAAHYELLCLCGCGNPEDAYNFCRDVLACFDRRKYHQTNLSEDWIDSELLIKAIIQERPDIAAHVFSHLFTNLDLLEHGGNVGGAWLTKDGERIVDMGPMTEELMREGQ